MKYIALLFLFTLRAYANFDVGCMVDRLSATIAAEAKTEGLAYSILEGIRSGQENKFCGQWIRKIDKAKFGKRFVRHVHFQLSSEDPDEKIRNEIRVLIEDQLIQNIRGYNAIHFLKIGESVRAEVKNAELIPTHFYRDWYIEEHVQYTKSRDIVNIVIGILGDIFKIDLRPELERDKEFEWSRHRPNNLENRPDMVIIFSGGCDVVIEYYYKVNFGRLVMNQSEYFFLLRDANTY